MHRTCEELFRDTDATILGNAAEPVDGIAYRSDAVKPGDAFFCIVGLKVDGHSFAQDAIDRGARVIVAERRLYLADATDVTVVVVPDSRRAMAHAACAFYGNPSRDFKLVGVTGTNGKTTTTYLVEAIARQAGYKTGVIGTVGMRIGDEEFGSDHTTPESPDLQRTFARMRDAGCEVVVMEVSSHALDLKRVWGTAFAVTAFTNLTQDHLDYHLTFDAYFEAKALLFGEDYPARRVVGADGKWGGELARRCDAAADDVVTFGFDAARDIHPDAVDYSVRDTRVALSACGQVHDFSYSLVGRFNVENVMCAFGIAVQLGIPAADVIAALSQPCLVPGRLQRIDAGAGDPYSVYVDYAHTPDALAKAIDAVAGLGEGRTIVVFGCGGDRDAAKRPIMGRAALAADYAIVTSDNPRSEDPASIVAEIVAGMEEGGTGAGDACATDSPAFEVVLDRREAIGRAVSLARPGDVVLIAGKGHEDYQIIGDATIHFDDGEEALLAMRAASDPSRG